MRWSSLAVLVASGLVALPARAQHAPLPPDVIALDSPEGERLLSESTAKADFVRLVSTYVTQEQPTFCGVASAVTVLNALPIEQPLTDLGRMYSQGSFFGEATRAVITPEQAGKGGLTLAQLANALQTHPTSVELTYGSDVTLDDMRARLSKNLGTADDYVIVNYQRGELGQESIGHISPLGAYHAGSDRFLVLDVARYKYPPHWVYADALHRAMRSTDIVSGKSRGFLVVKGTKVPKGPMFAAPGRRPTMILGGIIAAAFFLGVGVGVLLGRLRVKSTRADASTD